MMLFYPAKVLEFIALILLFFGEIWEKIAEIYLRSALRMIGKSINRNNFPLEFQSTWNYLSFHIGRRAGCSIRTGSLKILPTQ